MGVAECKVNMNMERMKRAPSVYTVRHLVILGRSMKDWFWHKCCYSHHVALK